MDFVIFVLVGSDIALCKQSGMWSRVKPAKRVNDIDKVLKMESTVSIPYQRP
ncbi:MAG: hypothetical protein JEY71_17190 [Sphaerochaeta sp.]|nr:hypothetical protein [Sphaerochaeta sp.]